MGSPSEEARNQGNAYIKRARTGVNTKEEKYQDFKKALSLYKKAISLARNDTERSFATKNAGTASSELGKLKAADGKVSEAMNCFRNTFIYYAGALNHGKVAGQKEAWIKALMKTYGECVATGLQVTESLDPGPRSQAIETYLSSIKEPILRYKCCKYYLNVFIKIMADELDEGNHALTYLKKCSHMMSEATRCCQSGSEEFNGLKGQDEKLASLSNKAKTLQGTEQASTESPSEKARKDGNSHITRARTEGNSKEEKYHHFKEALSLYRRAISLSRNVRDEKEQSFAMKNAGTASFELGKLKAAGGKVSEAVTFFHYAYNYYEGALNHGKLGGQKEAWVKALKKTYEECVATGLQATESLNPGPRSQAIETYLSAVDEPMLRYKCCKYYLNVFIKISTHELDGGNHVTALKYLKDCSDMMTEARKCCLPGSEEFNELKGPADEVKLLSTKAKIIQLTKEADNLVKDMVPGKVNETFFYENADRYWKAIKLGDGKQKLNDVTANAYRRLGDMYEKIKHDPKRAVTLKRKAEELWPNYIAKKPRQQASDNEDTREGIGDEKIGPQKDIPNETNAMPPNNYRASAQDDGRQLTVSQCEQKIETERTYANQFETNTQSPMAPHNADILKQSISSKAGLSITKYQNRQTAFTPSPENTCLINNGIHGKMVDLSNKLTTSSLKSVDSRKVLTLETLHGTSNNTQMITNTHTLQPHKHAITEQDHAMAKPEVKMTPISDNIQRHRGRMTTDTHRILKKKNRKPASNFLEGKVEQLSAKFETNSRQESFSSNSRETNLEPSSIILQGRVGKVAKHFESGTNTTLGILSGNPNTSRIDFEDGMAQNEMDTFKHKRICNDPGSFLTASERLTTAKNQSISADRKIENIQSIPSGRAPIWQEQCSELPEYGTYCKETHQKNASSLKISHGANAASQHAQMKTNTHSLLPHERNIPQMRQDRYHTKPATRLTIRDNSHQRHMDQATNENTCSHKVKMPTDADKVSTMKRSEPASKFLQGRVEQLVAQYGEFRYDTSEIGIDDGMVQNGMGTFKHEAIRDDHGSLITASGRPTTENNQSIPDYRKIRIMQWQEQFSELPEHGTYCQETNQDASSLNTSHGVKAASQYAQVKTERHSSQLRERNIPQTRQARYAATRITQQDDRHQRYMEQAASNKLQADIAKQNGKMPVSLNDYRSAYPHDQVFFERHRTNRQRTRAYQHGFTHVDGVRTTNDMSPVTHNSQTYNAIFQPGSNARMQSGNRRSQQLSYQSTTYADELPPSKNYSHPSHRYTHQRPHDYNFGVHKDEYHHSVHKSHPDQDDALIGYDIQSHDQYPGYNIPGIGYGYSMKREQQKTFNPNKYTIPWHGGSQKQSQKDTFTSELMQKDRKQQKRDLEDMLWRDIRDGLLFIHKENDNGGFLSKLGRIYPRILQHTMHPKHDLIHKMRIAREQFALEAIEQTNNFNRKSELQLILWLLDLRLYIL